MQEERGVRHVPAGAHAPAERHPPVAFKTGRSVTFANNGMVATSHPLAAQIGLDVLRRGGNAVDAAIATSAAMGLLEPMSCGIGGDLFAIVWDAKTRKLYGYNGSGRSPATLTLEYFQQQGITDIPPTGPLPVSVPGCVDAWFALHDKFGRLPMKKLLAPTIAYARDGFPVSELIAWYWQRSVPRLSKYPGFKEQFTRDGVAPAKGERWRNPYLADTLEAIGKGGRDAFYKGEIAKKIAADMEANGGILSYADLAQYRAVERAPVSGHYRGHTLYAGGPPLSTGIQLFESLHVLENYQPKGTVRASTDPDYFHYAIESWKVR